MQYYFYISFTTVHDNKLGMGEHKFNFNFKLPNNIPSSFEDVEEASVRYSLKGNAYRK